QIVETRFSRKLLLHEPAHLLERRAVGQPVEKRVVLSRPGSLQLLEPRDKPFRIARRQARARTRFSAGARQQLTFDLLHLSVFGQGPPPVVRGKTWIQPA